MSTMKVINVLLRSILITLVIICLINLLLMAFFHGNILVYVLICANPFLLLVTFPLSVYFELLYINKFVDTGMEYKIEHQQYVTNRSAKRAYYFLFGIILLSIVHVITIIYPMLVKPYFQYVYFAPLFWILLPGRRMLDHRSYKQKWIEDFSGITIFGIIVLSLIIVYASIVLLFLITAVNIKAQYLGMLLCEIFWIFIFAIGLFSSWYGKIGNEVTR